MTEVRINMYEGMFLFPQAAGADLGGAVAHVESILERADAELVSISKWDERRLAYDIKGNKRGVYLLTYFKADRSGSPARADCNLSEQLLRAMVVEPTTSRRRRSRLRTAARRSPTRSSSGPNGAKRSPAPRSPRLPARL